LPVYHTLGNSRQIPPNVSRSIDANRSLSGLARRIIKISASSMTRDRSRSITVPTISLHKSNIEQQHCPILDQLPADWIYIGTGIGSSAFLSTLSPTNRLNGPKEGTSLGCRLRRSFNRRIRTSVASRWQLRPSDDLSTFLCERYRQCSSVNQPVAESLLQSANLLWNHMLSHANEPRFGHTQKRLQASDDIHEHADSAYRPEQPP
jgi:hypothetical protein